MGNKSSTSSTYPQHDDPAYRKCQELKMERWIQMHYQIKEREQAIKIAHHRELFYWLSSFYITSLFGCFSFYQRSKRPVTLLPMLPLSFVMGYYADLAYGSKIHRINGIHVFLFCVNFVSSTYNIFIIIYKYLWHFRANLKRYKNGGNNKYKKGLSLLKSSKNQNTDHIQQFALEGPVYANDIELLPNYY